MSDATTAEASTATPTPSHGPYEWAIVPADDKQEDWIRQHFSFGSGDIHAVWLPKHENSVIGDDPEQPERAVLLCITGNGPKSKDNARFLAAMLSARERIANSKRALPIPTTPECVAWSEYAIELEAAMGIEVKLPEHMKDSATLLKRIAADADNGGSKKSDPTDAAELERLRKVEDEAADAFDRRLEEEQDGSYSIPVNEWSRWRSAREARIAFEAKIGGGS